MFHRQKIHIKITITFSHGRNKEGNKVQAISRSSFFFPSALCISASISIQARPMLYTEIKGAFQWYQQHASPYQRTFPNKQEHNTPPACRPPPAPETRLMHRKTTSSASTCLPSFQLAYLSVCRSFRRSVYLSAFLSLTPVHSRLHIWFEA